VLADLHVHTSRCGHARGTPEEYVQRAVDLGLSAIGFADHLPLTDREEPTLTMSTEDLPGYVAEIRELAERAPSGTSIHLGIEADYIPGTEEAVARMLARHPFDYVLGSVHFLDDWAFDHPGQRDRYEGLDVDAFWGEYFDTLSQAVSSGLFDVVAHADLAKKFDVFPSRDMRGQYEELARTVARANMAVELNTAGLHKPVGEVYPGRDLLHAFHSAGVPITFGSDAHAPEEVGRDFDRAVALAREVGYRDWVRYEGRVPSLVPL
jgi:histidinol-phosphatase (PHP family)